MNIWQVMIMGGLLTFGTRLSFIFLFSQSGIPEWLRVALRYVPIAVLSAIILPEVLISDGSLNFNLGNTRLLAAMVAILVAWRTRSALATILIGMAALYLFQMLIH